MTGNTPSKKEKLEENSDEEGTVNQEEEEQSKNEKMNISESQSKNGDQNSDKDIKTKSTQKVKTSESLDHRTRIYEEIVRVVKQNPSLQLLNQKFETVRFIPFKGKESFMSEFIVDIYLELFNISEKIRYISNPIGNVESLLRGLKKGIRILSLSILTESDIEQTLNNHWKSNDVLFYVCQNFHFYLVRLSGMKVQIYDSMQPNGDFNKYEKTRSSLSRILEVVHGKKQELIMEQMVCPQQGDDLESCGIFSMVMGKSLLLGKPIGEKIDPLRCRLSILNELIQEAQKKPTPTSKKKKK